MSKSKTNFDASRFVSTQPEECSVILLGESGVGKSTFINALVNYFEFDSFNDAEKSKMKYIIAAQFTMTDENFNQVTVQLGSDKNELHQVGKAATQAAKSHIIELKNNIKLHVIDTPGIGDPEGFNKDKENFQGTIKHLSTFKNLNGICILLKPNNARLDLHFRYCFKELLIHLHKNAAPNIVFCFTNSRSTFYRPGDTYSALEKLVSDVAQESGIKIPFGRENIFCFDNEAFRFLAALQQGVCFTEDEKKDFSTSWIRSSDNSYQMISYIMGLRVHDIKETIKLNQVKKILMELAKPIAEISQNIQINIKLATDKKHQLQSGSFDLTDLKNKLHITQVSLTPKPLGYPRTVCTHPSCVKYVQIGETSKVDYVTHCHPHCYLDGVKQETIGHPSLKGCACVDPSSGNCTICRHIWSIHMHITYENAHHEVQVIDSNIQTMIDQKEDHQKLIQAAIESAEKLIDQLTHEQNELVEVSARFAHFTRQNAISVFNDDLDAYLDLLIREEEGKKQHGANNDQVLNGLRDVKQNYIAQKRIFDDAFKAGGHLSIDDTLKLNEIDDLVDQLYNLPLSGQKLKACIDALQKISLK